MKTQMKIGLLDVLVCVLLLLTGCQNDLGKLEEFHILPKTETEKAKEYVDIVFNAAENGDEETIYDLFSDKVKEELGEDELRRQIKDLIEFYQGEGLENKSGVIEENTDNEYGVKRIMVKILYGVKTDNGDYECALTYVARSDNNTEEEGFECMQFAKKETVEETSGFMWKDYYIYHGVLIFE